MCTVYSVIRMHTEHSVTRMYTVHNVMRLYTVHSVIRVCTKCVDHVKSLEVLRILLVKPAINCTNTINEAMLTLKVYYAISH